MTQHNLSKQIQIQIPHPSYLLIFISLLGLTVFTWGCIDSRQDPRVAKNRSLTQVELMRIRKSMIGKTPNPKYKLNVTFSTRKGKAFIPSVLLYGVDLSAKRLQRGAKVTITYYFKPLRKFVSNWTIFLHVEAAKQHKFFLNHDHHPMGGIYPTKRWIPQRPFRSSYTLTIPKDFPGDTIAFYSGFWQRSRGNMSIPASARSGGKNRLLLVSVPLAGKGLQRPIYIAYRVKKAPVIDGKLDEAMWKGLPSTGNWPTYNNNKARFRTYARLAWDNKYLYAGFYCEDDDIWTHYKKRDDPIFKEEVIEFFVDANRNFRDYVELQVSPAGVIFDSFFVKYRWPRPWGRLSYNSGMLVRIHHQGTLNNRRDKDKAWTVEMRIPLAKLGPAHHMPPLNGDSWLINFYRFERSRRSHGEAQAWSPITTSNNGGDFHQIRRFGTLRFSTQVFADSPPPIVKTVIKKRRTPLPRKKAVILRPVLSPQLLKQKKSKKKSKNQITRIDLSKLKIKPSDIKPYKPKMRIYRPRYRIIHPSSAPAKATTAPAKR